MRKAIVILAAMFSVMALAQPNQDHTCQGGHNCNGGSDGGNQQQGQINVQVQRLDNNVTSDSRSNSEASSRSYSDSNSNSSADGGRATASGGESKSSSSAIAGDSASTGVGGDVNAGASIQIEGDEYDTAAASVAAAMASYCVNSAAGQGVGGGVSIGVQDQACVHYNAANRALLSWKQEAQWCRELNTNCDPGLKEYYLQEYRDNLAAAFRIVEQTSITGQVNTTTMQLAPFLGVLWILFLL